MRDLMDMILGLSMPVILIFGAGVLYSRTKTLATGMFFFGLILCTVTLTTLWVGNHPPIHIEIMNLLSTLAKLIFSIGLLRYALSLPKVKRNQPIKKDEL